MAEELTYDQQKWLRSLPVEARDHILSLLREGECVLRETEPGTFVLVQYPTPADFEW